MFQHVVDLSLTYTIGSTFTGQYLGKKPDIQDLTTGDASHLASPHFQWKFIWKDQSKDQFYIWNVGAGLYLSYATLPGFSKYYKVVLSEAATICTSAGNWDQIGDAETPDWWLTTAGSLWWSYEPEAPPSVRKSKSWFVAPVITPPPAPSPVPAPAPAPSPPAPAPAPAPPPPATGPPPIVPGPGPIDNAPLAIRPFDIAPFVRRAVQPPVDGLYFIIHRGVYAVRVQSINARLPVSVAIKAVRPAFTPGSTTRQQNAFIGVINQFIVQWKSLSHPNVMDLLGVTMGYGPFPAMITSWMSNGTVTDYLAANASANIDKVALIIDVAQGVEYLHSRNIIHSDLRASSVLVDDFGNASLADPGMLSVFQNSLLVTSPKPSNISRWMAPELLESQPAPTSRATDIYGFTMTALEIYTGQPPFSDLPDSAVAVRGMLAPGPNLPVGVTVNPVLVALWREGWDNDPTQRPQMSSYVTRLQAIP